jgi:hypothetical protein
MFFTPKLRAIKLTFCDMEGSRFFLPEIGVLVLAAEWRKRDWDHILRFKEPILRSLVVLKQNNEKARIELANVVSPTSNLETSFQGEPAYKVRLTCRDLSFIGQTQEQWRIPEGLPRLRMWP